MTMKKQEKTDTKRTSKQATIIKEMLEVAAQCREDAKKRIGGKLFLNNGDDEVKTEKCSNNDGLQKKQKLSSWNAPCKLLT